MIGIKHWQIVAVALLLASCTQSREPDFFKYRNLASYNLRSPKSAEFRNERTRTIWSRNGDRKLVYCAEINSDNEFGGKTGFSPAYMIVFRRPRNDIDLNHAYINNQTTEEYYLNCIREDTERKNGDVFSSILDIGSWNQDKEDEVKRMFPFVSNSPAPAE